MKFSTYLERTLHGAEGVTAEVAEQFSGLLARGHSIADLLGHYADRFSHLPVERLREMARRRRHWLLWRKRREQLAEARRAAKLPPLPDAAYDYALGPDQLDAVVRTARLCSQQQTSDEQQWIEMLHAGVDLWRSSVALARKRGTLRCRARDASHPQADRYEPYLRNSETPDDIAPHRWLAMRRGQREGVLELELELPREQLLEQVELHRERLGPAAADRSVESLADELVLDDLQAWLLTILDSEAEQAAIRQACDNLAGMLRGGGLQARRVGALFIARSGNGGRTDRAGLVVADREGDLVTHRVLKAEGNWISRATQLFGEQSVHHVIVPAGGQLAEKLAPLERALDEAGMQVVRVRAAAIAEARRPLMDPPHRLGPSVASALVLARRALEPIKEWAAVDPVNIGVAEYQNDLAQERLRAALTETIELCRLERRRGKRGGTAASAARNSSAAAAARLNPLVKTIADLRPGMTVNGVISNVSHFGAFVNVGLPQEALIHISELSDRFVSNPNEVVRIGQQIKAQVLGVEPARNRISLSMKTARRGPPARASGGDGGARRADPPRPRPASRAEALANLERLFKK